MLWHWKMLHVKEAFDYESSISQLTRYFNFLHTFVCVIINKHVNCYRLAMVIFLTKNHRNTEHITNIALHVTDHKTLQKPECKTVKEVDYKLVLNSRNIVIKSVSNISIMQHPLSIILNIHITIRKQTSTFLWKCQGISPEFHHT